MANEQRRPYEPHDPNRGNPGNVGNTGTGQGRESDRGTHRDQGSMNRDRPSRDRHGDTGMGGGRQRDMNRESDIEE